MAVTRCMDCEFYSPMDPKECTPEMCLHDDSGWDKLDPYVCGETPDLVYPTKLYIPYNCPLFEISIRPAMRVDGEGDE